MVLPLCWRFVLWEEADFSARRWSAAVKWLFVSLDLSPYWVSVVMILFLPGLPAPPFSICLFRQAVFRWLRQVHHSYFREWRSSSCTLPQNCLTVYLPIAFLLLAYLSLEAFQLHPQFLVLSRQSLIGVFELLYLLVALFVAFLHCHDLLHHLRRSLRLGRALKQGLFISCIKPFVVALGLARITQKKYRSFDLSSSPLMTSSWLVQSIWQRWPCRNCDMFEL